MVSQRFSAWMSACDVYGLALPPVVTNAVTAGLPPGLVRLRAARTVTVAGQDHEMTLDVAEVWLPGPDPLGERRLERGGCHLAAATWHAQVGLDTRDGDAAERLDVVPVPDPSHARVHRHPFGRVDFNLPVPDGWLHALDRTLGNALSLPGDLWDDLPVSVRSGHSRSRGVPSGA